LNKKFLRNWKNFQKPKTKNQTKFFLKLQSAVGFVRRPQAKGQLTHAVLSAGKTALIANR
jgi:hypothetical protein